MKTFFSDNLPPLHGDEQLWLYNGLDVSITRECFDALVPQSGGFAYDMPRAMQGPALTMMRRGVLVDTEAAYAEIRNLLEDIDRCEYIFNRIAADGWGRPTNWRSTQQLMTLFYDVMKIPPVMVYDKTKRERRAAVNIEALEKLKTDTKAKHLVELILEMRNAKKLVDVLGTKLDPDGRLRCGYQVAGTMTGRWSSNESAFHTGTNLQNITDRARRIIIPDPGNIMVQMDLAQAESRMVAAISGDSAYWDACHSGDLHTAVCQMVWPELDWPADPKDRKEFASTQKFYRHFSYRDIAKRAGHGSNYGGSPHALSVVLKMEVKVLEAFQSAYFKAFPEIRRWHARVAAQLAKNNTITTALGRRCHFYGRPGDSTVLKSAIAYEPQSLIGDVLNLGLYNVWQKFDLTGRLQLLLQVHDAIVWQAPISDAADLIPQVLDAVVVPIHVNGREVKIPSEATWGWNWGKAIYNKDTDTWANPAGQREFSRGKPIHAAG